VWVDHEVQQLNLDFELGIMELDVRGIRIPHERSLRTFLSEVPCCQACELPDACAHLPIEPEIPAVQQPELLPDPPPVRTQSSAGTTVPRPSPAARVGESVPAENETGGPTGPKLLAPPSAVPISRTEQGGPPLR
jgi:hypothetical protein